MSKHVQVALVGYAAQSLARRRGRTLGVAGGLVAAVTLIAAVLFVTDALRGEAARAEVAAPDLVVSRLEGGRPSLVEAGSAATLAKIPGVARAKARVWGYLFLPALEGNATIVGLGEAPALPPLALRAGSLPSKHGECALGGELAGSLGVRVGDTIRFPALDDRGPSCKVSGVFSSTVGLWASDVALVPEDDARTLLDVPPGEATDIALDLTNPDESAVVARTAVATIPGARVVEKRLLARVHALSFGRRAGFVLGASIPAILALLVLAYDRASGLGAAERREIAILKACGWSTGDVLAAKLYESLVVALLASAMGLVLGYAWAFWLGAPGLREVLAGWSVLYPSFRLTPTVSVAEALGIAALVTAPYVALAVGPSYRAAIVDPMEVLRGG